MRKAKVGFVCFGEVHTPPEAIVRKRDQALKDLSVLDMELLDGGIVTDDPAYADADRAVAALAGKEMDALIVCVAGWIPSHAVVRVTDKFRHLPMVLWGLCGWIENGHIVTTADQAGTCALRPAFEALDYRFKYIYSVMGEEPPVKAVWDYIAAARAASLLRQSRVGTMGYRDMLLYGTQFEGNSLRGEIGVEVEPMEMLEMVQRLPAEDDPAVLEQVAWIRANWQIQGSCEDALLIKGVRYALSLAGKIRERGWQAITLLDVDGMKKLEGFPPAMVFMLLDHLCGVQTIPENDVMGAVTQLMVHYLTGETAAYLEFYEFFRESVLIGVPDFVPKYVTDGPVKVMPTAFGLLSASLLNVSEVRPGRVTMARLVYKKGRYYMHLTTGEAMKPPVWEECGWAPPAPQLPSLEVKLDCPVGEFARKVSSQHTIICYGDHTEKLRDLCALLGIGLL